MTSKLYSAARKNRVRAQSPKVMPKAMVDVYELPSLDWVILKLANVDEFYRAIIGGAATLQHLEGFCGAIRMSLFEYLAYSARESGAFSEGVEALMKMAGEVLAQARRERIRAGDKAKWDRVITSIERHRSGLKEALATSRQELKRKSTPLTSGRLSRASLHSV